MLGKILLYFLLNRGSMYNEEQCLLGKAIQEIYFIFLHICLYKKYILKEFQGISKELIKWNMIENQSEGDTV